MVHMTTASPDPLALQATLVDFALAELVRQHRASFPPLWSSESWAKLLIWLALARLTGAQRMDVTGRIILVQPHAVDIAQVDQLLGI